MRKKLTQTDLRQLVRFLQSLSVWQFVLLVLVAAIIVWLVTHERRPTPTDRGPAGSLAFTFWNVENLFDDQDDPLNDDDDEDWYARNPKMVDAKLEQLALALSKMNGGQGPDILGLCEVESRYCLEVLRDKLNARLGPAGYNQRSYKYIAFEPNRSGRRFAPGMLSRVKIDDAQVRRPEVRGRADRLLVAPILLNGHQLSIIAAHWTSRRTDRQGDRRAVYAQGMRDLLASMQRDDPDADVLLCGDFNDEFNNDSLQRHLKATALPEVCRNGIRDPFPLCLSAQVEIDQEGTYYYRSKFQMLDHICVSRGLLDDQGWSVLPETFRIIHPEWMQLRNGAPKKFGAANHIGERGFSDHFPIAVSLRCAGPVAADLP